MLDPDKDMEWKKVLRNYTEEPDDDLWARIEATYTSEKALNEEQKRLADYQEEPDSIVWQRVSHTLKWERNVIRWERVHHVISLASALVLFYSLSLYIPQQDKPKAIANSERHAEQPKDSLNTTNDAAARHDRENISAKSTGLNSTNQPASVGSQKTKSVQHKGDSKWQVSGGSDRLTNSSSVSALAGPDVATDQHNLFPVLPLERGSPADSHEFTAERPVADESGKERVNEDSLMVQSDSLIEQSIPQVPAKRNAPKRSYGLYALVMPTLGYQQIRPIADDGILVESFKRVAAFSPSRLGIRAELGWAGSISSRLEWTAGVLYYQRKQTFTYQFTDTLHSEVVPVPDQVLTYEVTAVRQAASLNYEVKNVGLILGMNYQIKSGRVKQKIGLASELHRNLSRETGANNFYLFGDVFYRISYEISGRMDLMLQPTLNYGLRLSDQLNAPFYVRPYGLGLSFGCIFRLGQ